MGTRGPLQNPNARRRERVGQPRGSTLPALPSVASLQAVKPPSAPRGLSAAGRAVWRRTWQEGAAWLTDADTELVSRLAQVADEIDGYRKALADGGPVLLEPIVTPRGDVVGERRVANPASKQLRDAGVELLALATALGLSVSSRTRLGLTVARTRRALVAIRQASA